MKSSNRFDFNRAGSSSWATLVAEDVLSTYPDNSIYTTAAGISPSGVVHFGNFRDVVTSHLVREEFKKLGKKSRLIFSWDNYDRFRKVPAGVPESFSQYIGMPLAKIPDPWGCHSSYAEHFQKPFEEAMQKLGIEIEYRDQYSLYTSGEYDQAIFEALKKRREIADILLSFMSEKAKGEKGVDPEEYRENYYPIAVYSRFTGKDSTKVLSYDGQTTIKYLCVESGKEDEVDLSKERLAKLSWKVDWPMRWRHEGVVFEPGGHDHASPGSSYDVGTEMAPKIFDYPAPYFAEYKFVGIQGAGSKMSGSKGNAVSPLELLEVYEPAVLKWLYFRKSPNQSFELAFNSEIYRQYDEYDAEHKELKAIPFRQAVGFGQVVQWQADKLEEVLKALDLHYSPESIKTRLTLAHNWLTKYNPEEEIKLDSNFNSTYFEKMSEEERARVTKLAGVLIASPKMGVGEIEELVYSLPKSPELSEEELKKAQRAFFKDVYNLLIGKDTGPRLSTFLWAVDRSQVLRLLGAK